MRRGGTISWAPVLVALLLGAALPPPAAGLDLIGCLFEDVCEESERCFKDGAFGRCVSSSAQEADLRRVELSQDDLAELATLLELLVAEGHHWRHIYAQCVLQTKLLSLQTGERHDGSVCELVNDNPGLPPGSHAVPALPPLTDEDEDDLDSLKRLRDDDLESLERLRAGVGPGLPPGSRAVPALSLPSDDSDEDRGQDLESDQDGALVRFDPDGDDGYIENLFAPATYQSEDEPLVPDSYRPLPSDLERYWTSLDDSSEELPGIRFAEELPADLVLLRGGGVKRSSPPEEVSDEDEPAFLLGKPTEARLERLQQLQQLVEDVEELAELQQLNNLLSEQMSVPVDSISVLEREAAAAGVRPGDLLEPLATLEREEAAEEAAELAAAEQTGVGLRPESPLVIEYDSDSELYPDYSDYYDSAPIPLSVRSDPEFRRAERLDIKKPGPWFGVNNYAFDYDFDGKAPPPAEGDMDRLPVDPLDTPLSLPIMESASDPGEDVFSVDSESRRVDSVAEDDVTEELTAEATEAPSDGDPDKGGEPWSKKSLNGKYSRVPDPRSDTDTYIKVLRPFRRWTQGQQLVQQLEQDLSLPPNTFGSIRVFGDKVMFSVRPNKLGYNSAYVREKLKDDKIRRALETKLDVTIEEAGPGDGSHQQWSVHDQPAQTALGGALGVRSLSIALGVVVAVCLLVVVGVFGWRRYRRGKDKLKGLANPDTEASQDYQELCRSRMAARVADKSDTPEKPQRVHSLSKESDGTASPTSRSSTSSWSEEPVVSNMDISTGHMVLSYMEDHLKNKDKLEEEWRALCAYEAEPSACTLAAKQENANKNRTMEAVPYDHSRVTLNAVTNATGGDYINASTITDHDPRNPAYIATQGPLPHTANDFWQMVWEQGSVVMVMLTRLTENGSGMCHRYWPEEGSELYHIYEVHLVSEHIWCDEYLVRSFYLKNLKTSETRTVTQFHFLAWPDNGVPTSTKALLEFRRKVNKSYRGRSCPVIVHCSDGCGRAGTYCLIDMVLNRMYKGAKEIDIAASLEHIRDQRAHMVRTRAQFEFVLMAVAEEVHAILKALPQ